jgi:hypothetical protein
MTDTTALDFDRAEPAAPAPEGIRCAGCGQPIIDAYWQVNAAVACERCKNGLARERATRRPGRFLLAGLYGTLAAAAGAAVWYAVRAATDYEFGLLAIFIGLGVGFAVKRGAQGRGGWAYQALAMFLTYMAIVSTYVPMLVKALGDQARAQEAAIAAAPAAPGALVRPASSAATEPAAPAPAATPPAAPTSPAQPPAAGDAPAAAETPAPSLGGLLLALAFVLALAAAAPFLAGLENLMGLAIIGFGLYEAWKINRAQPLAVTGPFEAKAAPAGAPAVG